MRESGRERVRERTRFENSKRHDGSGRGREPENRYTSEEEWTTVSNKRRRQTPMKKGHQLHRKPASKVEWKKEGGHSIFIENLPPCYDASLLKRLFQRYGRIINCHMPWKRRIVNGTVYGFVVFNRESDGLQAIEKLNGVPIFGYVLKVMWSHSKKKKDDYVEVVPEKMKDGKSSVEPGRMADGGRERRSYAEVVKQKKQEWRKISNTNKDRDGEEIEQSRHTEKASVEGISIIQWREMVEKNEELLKKIENLESIVMEIKGEYNNWKSNIGDNFKDAKLSALFGEKISSYSSERIYEENQCRGLEEVDEVSRVVETCLEEAVNNSKAYVESMGPPNDQDKTHNILNNMNVEEQYKKNPDLDNLFVFGAMNKKKIKKKD